MASISIEWQTLEVEHLVEDIINAEDTVRDRAERDVKASILDIRDGWQNRARGTARRHGKHYPGTIREEIGGLEAVVGPISAMPQGGMGRGFEWGSINQPPHLDMTLTVDVQFPKFIAKVENDMDGWL